MPQFRKKPVLIEAEQFLVSDCVEDWPEGISWDTDEKRYYVTTIHNQRAYLDDGDWIIPEPKPGFYYPCKPDIFTATYEPVGVTP